MTIPRQPRLPRASRGWVHPDLPRSATSFYSSSSLTARHSPPATIPFVFIQFRTLLHSRNSQLLSFQSFPHSLPRSPGGGGSTGSNRNLLKKSLPVSLRDHLPRCPASGHPTRSGFLTPVESTGLPTPEMRVLSEAHGGTHFRFSNFDFRVSRARACGDSRSSSLECALMQFLALTPLECAVTKTRPRKSFKMRSSEKKWGEGSPHRSRNTVHGPRPYGAPFSLLLSTVNCRLLTLSRPLFHESPVTGHCS